MESGVEQRLSISSNNIKGSRDKDNLEAELSGLEGIRSANVDAEAHRVDVVFDSTLIDANAIRRAVEDAGYGPDQD